MESGGKSMCCKISVRKWLRETIHLIEFPSNWYRIRRTTLKWTREIIKVSINGVSEVVITLESYGDKTALSCKSISGMNAIVSGKSEIRKWSSHEFKIGYKSWSENYLLHRSIWLEIPTHDSAEIHQNCTQNQIRRDKYRHGIGSAWSTMKFRPTIQIASTSPPDLHHHRFIEDVNHAFFTESVGVATFPKHHQQSQWTLFFKNNNFLFCRTNKSNILL